MVAAFHQILSRRKPILTGKYIRTINQELRRPTQVGSSISEYYAKVGVLHWKTTEVKGTKLNENSNLRQFPHQGPQGLNSFIESLGFVLEARFLNDLSQPEDARRENRRTEILCMDTA